MRKVAIEETEHYTFTRSFLNNPKAFLRQLGLKKVKCVAKSQLGFVMLGPLCAMIKVYKTDTPSLEPFSILLFFGHKSEADSFLYKFRQ